MHDIYSFLEYYGLGSKSLIETRLRKMNIDKIGRILEEYAEEAKERTYIARNAGETNIYPDSVMEVSAKDFFRRLGVYANHVFLHDPIANMDIEFKRVFSDIALTYKMPKKHDRDMLFRKSLSRAIETALDFRQLVESSLVSFAPTYLFTRIDPSAIFSTSLFGPDGQYEKFEELPPDAKAIMASDIFVHSTNIQGHRDAELKPSNIIAIDINGDPHPHGRCLMSMSKSENSDEENATMKVGLQLIVNDPKGPDKIKFDQFVEAERQRIFRQRMDGLHYDLSVASGANASFITNLPFSSKLASMNMSVTPVDDPVVETLMKMDLPYLDGVSLSELARARSNEAAFEDFRVALRNACKSLEAETDETKRQQRANEIVQDLVNAPIARIDQKMKQLNNLVTVESVLGITALAAAFVSGGTSLLATSVGVGAAYVVEKRIQHSIQSLPSYFYWDMTKEARKARK